MTHLHRFPTHSSAQGGTRQALADSPDLMIVAFAFEAGTMRARYRHPHVQSTFVESWRFRFEVGADTGEVGPGDGFVIPSGVEHGCTCLSPGRLIDGFTPAATIFCKELPC